jgi:pimeloyl-ACP methyl ester carboxylesterase
MLFLAARRRQAIPRGNTRATSLAATLTPNSRHFEFDGQRLVYDEYGTGSRVVVLLPGLLFSRKMHRPLAESLAERGHRVLCLDLLGHGDSDRPPEMWHYSMTIFGRQAIALLDHAEIDQAVIGGTSLGANASLEAATAAPDRVKGLLIEMPVLDNALLGCAIGFTPLLAGLTFGAPVARVVAGGARLIPRGLWHLGDMLLDWVSQDPKPSASVLQGLFFGRVAPPREERRRMQHRTLVIGHYRDPIHPFSDSDMLVRELPNARLVQASSILELRLTPERLTSEIVMFVEECFRRAPRGKAARQRAPAGGRRARSTRRPS